MKFFPNIKKKSPVPAWRRSLISLGCAFAVAASVVMQAYATELPSGVLNYLRQKDPQVKVRFDGVVVFHNGETYVPVIPQDPSLNPDSQQVVALFPEKAAYPDLIQFDNNFFLMRLIQTASGRLTFPKMAEYPIQLKEGLLPQDFVLPDNLFIPVELKVILGALPYNPTAAATPTAPNSEPAAVIARPANNSPLPASDYQLKSTMRLTYVFDLVEQKLIGIDTITGRKQGDVPLDCVPSSLRLSTDGKLLFAPCLSTNELVVIDTGSNLVKTRVPVGQRPNAVLYFDNSQDVLISNSFSPFLSVVNSEALVAGQKVDLPGNGGAMTRVPAEKMNQIAVADAFKAKIYLVDVNTRAVVKTLNAVPDISALRAFRDVEGHVRIWAVSRTKGQMAIIDAENDKILKVLDVGAKPVDMAEFGDKLYVVSAGTSQVDVVDRNTQTVVAHIPLEADSFPSGIVTMLEEKRAYVVTAASNNLVVINLSNNQVENTFPVEFRANMIATVPDQTNETPDAVVIPSPALDTTASNGSTSKKGRDSASQKAQNTQPKRHGLFGWWASSVSPQANSQPSTSHSSSQGGHSNTGNSPVSQRNTTAQPKNTQSPSQGVNNSGSGIATPVSIPTQPGTASSSPLYGESQSKFRLFLGGQPKRPSSSLSPETDASQAAKTGARLISPKSSPSSADDTVKVGPQPADSPNSLLMMAPDLQK